MAKAQSTAGLRCDRMCRMHPSAQATLAALQSWHADQQPLVRAVSRPMVEMVDEVLTSYSGQVEVLTTQVATLSAQIESANASELLQLVAEYKSSLDQALVLNQTLGQKLDTALARIDALEKKPFEPISERKKKKDRTPDARREAHKRKRGTLSDEEKAERRKAAEDKRTAILEALRTVTVTVTLPSDYVVIESAEPATRVYYEWNQGELVRVVVNSEQGVLADGVTMTALRVDEVAEGGIYGPALYAKVVNDKVLNSMPLRRQERAFQTLQAPMPVSTLCTMFHRAATLTEPLYLALQAHVAATEHVHADETPLPIIDDDQIRRGWMWVFATTDALLFAYSKSRGKSTPEAVLGKSRGTLVVDGYSGYHCVTGEDARARGGCWSHARRGLYQSRDQDPKRVQVWLDAIGELFYVEEVASDEGILGTPAHAKRRETVSAPIVAGLMSEAAAYLKAAPDTSSTLYKAVSYMKNQAGPLSLFLTEPKVPIHNNVSERALRIVALLRKNALFAGHDEAAQNYAQLLSLLTTCRMHDVDPETWLADVLIEVQRPVAGRIAADLLPWNWKRDRGKTVKPLFDLRG